MSTEQPSLSDEWTRHKRVILPAVGLVWCALIWLTLPVDDPIRFLAGAVSSQRAAHSLVVAGQRLDFDARMSGVYLAFPIAFLAIGSRGHAAAPSVRLLFIAAMLGLITALDGTNSLLDDRFRGAWYAPSNHLRFIAGIAGGTCIALIVREIAGSLWPDAEQLSQRHRAGGVAAAAIVTALLAIAVRFGPRQVVNMAALAGAVTLYGTLALMMVRLALDRPEHAAAAPTWFDAALRWPLAPAGVVSMMVMLATLRSVL